MQTPGWGKSKLAYRLPLQKWNVDNKDIWNVNVFSQAEACSVDEDPWANKRYGGQGMSLYPAVQGRVRPVYSPVTTLGFPVNPPEYVALEASGFTTISETRLQALQNMICSAHRYPGFWEMTHYIWLGEKELAEMRRTWLACCLMEWEWIGQHSC